MLENSDLDIWTASQLGDLQRVSFLTYENPNLAIKPGGVDEVTPLHWAALNNRVDVIKFLLSKGASPSFAAGVQRSTPLHWATSRGSLEAISILADHAEECDLGAKDASGYTPLHIAAQHGHVLAISLLIAHGARVNQCDPGLRTALHWAAIQGHAEAAYMLVIEGDENEKRALDKDGRTPLHWAAIKGHSGISNILLKTNTTIENHISTVVNSEAETSRGLLSNSMFFIVFQIFSLHSSKI